MLGSWTGTEPAVQARARPHQGLRDRSEALSRVAGEKRKKLPALLERAPSVSRVCQLPLARITCDVTVGPNVGKI